ncbi:hypothetical protein HPULCUR_010415 [Helicostylum pulchrum]|uniref:F-box domain-containing protein n=1 Tax=Helicostylum pulchrum TaxID=562976 RepID=A0ABP9YD93_9FUNG
MTRKKTVKQLVNPLRKLSLLTSNNTHTFRPDLEFVPEQQDSQEDCHENNDLLSLFPREVVLQIFSLLSFQDLIRVQLTCRLWRRLTQDTSIWRNRLQDLNSRFTDIYAHMPSKSVEASSLPWKTRYCRAITFANWRMGTVQKLNKIDENNGRLLSVKLREHLLVTLAEDNTVKLYQYTTDLGFTFKTKWSFGDQPNNAIECVDVLPDINILVVAQRGSKCMFYDINKGSKHDPIQVLKGGSHPWFVPDSISVNQDYFALSGRKPSAVFVWNWRKGVRLSNRVFDNQPHNVFLSGDNLITVSVDGVLHVFDIFDSQKEAFATHHLNASSIPCIEYDNSLNIVLAPHASRRIHHYRWNPVEQYTSSDEESDGGHQFPPPPSPSPLPTPSSSLPAKGTRRLSTTFINLLGLKPNNNIPTASVSTSSINTTTVVKKTSKEFYKSVRLRRHSSYNDYGYACQMKTDQYIKQHKREIKRDPLPVPNFEDGPNLVHSIRTTPLGSAAKEIINVAIHGERVATVNRQGDISLYALNGTTAGRVTLLLNDKQEWMQSCQREDDDLSDGYDFVRSRLAMGEMGIVFGAEGSLWWLDFGCRPMT